ncbi:hypothetical protein B7993_15295, partial [Fibrobacter sp. UWH3]
ARKRTCGYTHEFPGHRMDIVRPGYSMAYVTIGQRTFVLFRVQKVSKFQVRIRANPARVTLVAKLPHDINEKRREVECAYSPVAFDCLEQINANNPRPKSVP